MSSDEQSQRPEPMTDERLAEIREQLDRKPAVPFTISETGAAQVQMGDLWRIVHTAFALLAEVEQLREELEMVRSHRSNYAHKFVSGLEENERLEAENAAMREIVRAVAEARWGAYPSGEHLFGMGDAMELKMKARTLVEQWGESGT